MLEQAGVGEEPLGIHPDTHKPIYLKAGRFGPYVQMGTSDDDEKPKNASLLPGMQPTDVNLETAIKLLSLPRTVGDHPQSGEPIVAFNGKFGPYIKCGSETRSLPGDIAPTDVTLQQALELLAQPKTRGRGRAAPREPLKTFDNSPVTGQPVKLLSGRYGNYVTDGTTNATLPKDYTPESLTFEQALDLLAERAARGPATPRGRRGRAKAATTGRAQPKTAKKKPGKKAAPAEEDF
jgi:DNA topoisomerase-1